MSADAGRAKARQPDRDSARAPAGEERPKRSRAEAAKARRLVVDVAERHFGVKPRSVVEQGGGLTNSVWRLRIPQGEFIVRTHADPTKIHDYLKEQWAMDAARGVGVPTPRVLEVGNFADSGRPYVIAQHVDGIDGRHATDRLAVVEALGRAAARLHSVPTRGFGSVFDWSSNELSRHTTWAGWLADGFGVERRLRTLQQQRMLAATTARRLRATAATMSRWRKRPVLHHGDLRLKNALVDAESCRLVAIIDWEACCSAPAPYWDLSLALHDLGVDEKEAFLAGYGMRPAAFDEALAFIRFFNVLNYADAVETAAKRKDDAKLERLRARLRGGLDLYAV